MQALPRFKQHTKFTTPPVGTPQELPVSEPQQSMADTHAWPIALAWHDGDVGHAGHVCFRLLHRRCFFLASLSLVEATRVPVARLALPTATRRALRREAPLSNGARRSKPEASIGMISCSCLRPFTGSHACARRGGRGRFAAYRCRGARDMGNIPALGEAGTQFLGWLRLPGAASPRGRVDLQAVVWDGQEALGQLAGLVL